MADLGSDQGIAAGCKRLSVGDCNLLVNNAGFSCFGAFDEASIDVEQQIVTVNCRAIMSLSHAFLQAAEAGDAMINLSSVTNYLPTPIQPTYVATKNFIASFSEALWYQQRAKGIYVQALCPGIAKTQFIERAADLDESRTKLLDWISQSPETVVATSLGELERRRKVLVVPGLANKLMVGFIKVLPRKPVVWAMGKIGELA